MLETPKTHKTVAEILTHFRKKAKLSQASLAQKCACAPSLIAGIEKGHRLPSHDTSTRIVEVLGIPEDDFRYAVQYQRIEKRVADLKRIVEYYGLNIRTILDNLE